MAMRGGWFGASDESRVFGWIGTPESGSPAPAVVLCPGLGQDAVNAHYTYRRVAMQLTHAGLITVRFDYQGIGDSAGDGLGGNRVEAWLQSIAVAVAVAREAGATSVSLVGLRVGALLAEHAAERIPDLKALVLWDPSSSGRAFVRSQRALELFSDEIDETAVKDHGIPIKHHGVPWLAMSPAGLEELRNLKAPVEARRPPMPTLLLHRPKDASTDRVRTRLAGQPVQSIEVTEQREFLEVDPLHNSVPEQTVATLVDWLQTTLLSAEAVVATAPEVGVVPSVASVTTADHAVVQQHSPVGEVIESIVRLGPADLFGIETVAERPVPNLPVVLFLNSGRDLHVGPGHLWVRTARALAALGFRCVRFDLSGLGESAPRRGQPDRLAFGPEAFRDIEEAAQAISPEDPSNIVFIGLCSGGYHGLELGLTLKPRAVCAVNPIISFTPPELAYGPLDPRRQICIPKLRITATAAQRITFGPVHKLLVRVAWVARRMKYRDRRQSQWLGELVDSGVMVYGICGPGEALEMLGGGVSRLPALTATGRLRVDVVEGLHHALVPQDDQEVVGERLTAYLTQQFLADQGTEEPVPNPTDRGASVL